MKVLILNASPKKKGGASRYFSKLLKAKLIGCNITTVDIINKSDYTKAIQLLQDIDALVISAPLYNDSIPAHFVDFLIQAEAVCKDKNYSFKVYAISNSGFVEGVQNKTHLKMYEAWCNRANLCFGGGLGIGGGVMLRVLSILLPIFLLIAAVQVGSEFTQTGYVSLNNLISANIGVLIALFFSMGAYINIFRLSLAIRGGNSISNLYTRVLIPSFIFLVMADIFMAISYIINIPGRLKRCYGKL